MSKLTPFEWSVFKPLRSVSDSSVGVAVSGGVDSVVLAFLLARLAPRLKLQVTLAHIHHGFTGDERLDAYRSQAQAFCEEFARKLNFAFFTNSPPSVTRQSEEELRNYRYDQLAQCPADYLALAHNFDDLFETRLMRLIRGTDAEGLKAMEVQKGKLLRPLLFAKRLDIEAYAREQALSWLEDPSNRDERYLRNWLRATWIPLLEKRAPGASHRFAVSLQGLTDKEHFVPEIHEGDVSLTEYMSLSQAEKAQLIARLFQFRERRNYTRGQIFEVIKRLDSGPLGSTFVVGGLAWTTNAQRLSVAKISKR